MRHLLLAALLAAYAQTAVAANLSLTLGTRDETGAEDRLPAAGIAVDIGSAGWPMRPEFGAAIGLDPVHGGDESELSLGAVKYWPVSAGRIHLGLGLSTVSFEFGANSGTSSGVYGHGGMSWGRRSTRVGLDLRYLDADDPEISGARFAVGYFQMALLVSFGEE